MTRLVDLTSQASLATRYGRVRARRLPHGRFEPAIAYVAIGLSAVLFSAITPPRPRFVWNETASAPQGLYFVSSTKQTLPGDMVIAHVPKRFHKLVDQRRYIPSNLPLVKHVAAAAGDQVCAHAQTVRINGHWVVLRRTHDSMGRSMPMWSGCARLRHGDLFLLSSNPASFDGRYVGVTGAYDVIGEARLLWAR